MTLGPQTVWSAVRAQAERTPERQLSVWLNDRGDVVDHLRYGEFVVRTGQLARHLQRELGLPVGARVLLVYPPGLSMITAFFACVRIGLVPVPVYPPSAGGFAASLRKMEFIAADCDASAVLTERTLQWSLSFHHARHRIASLFRDASPVMSLPWIATNDVAGGPDDVTERHSPLLFLQYTSGSTSEPKGVMVTNDGMLDNADAVVDHTPLGVSWLPQYHDMGLIGYYLFFAIKGGTTYGFSPLDFIRRPALWLQAISRYRGTASSAPNFAYAYCLRPGKVTAEDVAGLDLGSLRFLMNAAEPVDAEVMRAFVERFAPYGLAPRALFSAYGLAEYTLAVSNYGRRSLRLDRALLQAGVAHPVSSTTTTAIGSRLAHEATEVSSCGLPVPGAAIAIVGDGDRSPRRLGERQVGEVWVRGPSLGAGYFGRATLSEAVFGAPLDGERWLRTGDLGFIDHEELFVCGRKKDVIIIHGHNIYPHDLEDALQRHPSVRPGGVIACGTIVDGEERIAALIELKDTNTQPDPRELQALVNQHVGCVVELIVFVAPKSLPKTSSGKPRRQAARAALESGTLTAVATHYRQQTVDPAHRSAVGSQATTSVLSSLDPAFAVLIERTGARGDEEQTFAELGLDSVALVELAHHLGERLTALGLSELVGSIDVDLLQRASVAQVVASLSELSETSAASRERFRDALARLDGAHRARERTQMEQDANLPPEKPNVVVATGARRHERPVIFLTGATGFLGPFLLRSLLEQTDAEVRVLVRAEDDAAARRRLLSGLAMALGAQSGDGQNDPMTADDDVARFADRIVPVRGDLARPQLGLDASTWRALAEETSSIVHNGAWVNYLYDYTTMRAANVVGTHEVLRLAWAHRPKVMNHISTTFIFGWSTKETLLESDTCDRLELLDFGYAQTKWASEQMVLRAIDAGLPGRVFRPALLTPSVDGRGSHFDIAIRLLAFMMNHGLGTTAQNQVSFSPVDVAAHNMVAIANDERTLGKTFHVTRDQYASLSDITAILSTVSGRSFASLPLMEFVPEVIARCRPHDVLFPLLGFFMRSTANITAMEFKRYDNANFRAARDACQAGLADPPLDDVVLGLFRFMKARGLIDV